MNQILSISVALCLVHAASTGAAGQTVSSNAPDRARDLHTLQEAAIRMDPRYAALQLEREQTALKLRAIRAARLPAIGAEGRAQYQSDVPTPPPLGPGGAILFSPSKATYDASVRIDQAILDPSVHARLAAEEAQLAEAQARTRTALFGLRRDVNDAFFSAALLQERLGALDGSIADLEARLRETNARVAAGTALPLEAASVEASLLHRQQDRLEVQTSRRTALDRLARLTGLLFDAGTVLPLPELAAAVTRARGERATIRSRPEYEQFARARERLARQADVVSAQDEPRVSAFGRAGYGRPGLNIIDDRFDTYGLAGIQVQWKAWDGGAAARERDALGVQRDIVATDEAAFAKQLDSELDAELATVDRLARSLPLDERIVTLREEILRATEARFREGVITASEYLDRTTDLLEARFARAGHRTELAHTSARFLTTLGLEVR